MWWGKVWMVLSSVEGGGERRAGTVGGLRVETRNNGEWLKMKRGKRSQNPLGHDCEILGEGGRG